MKITEVASHDILTELSNELLGRYKTAAGKDASAADKEGAYKRGNKRFSGIVQATKKQFDNDAKKHSVKESGPFKMWYLLYGDNEVYSSAEEDQLEDYAAAMDESGFKNIRAVELSDQEFQDFLKTKILPKTAQVLTFT